MIQTRTVVEGFTQSELSLLSQCAMKWHLTYNLRLSVKGSFALYFMVGDVVHQVLEQIYKTMFQRYQVATLQFPQGAIPTIRDIEKAAYWNVVLPVMIEAYVHYWKAKDKELEVLSYEEEVEAEYKGFTIRGKIDLSTRKRTQSAKPFIWDHKTTFRLDNNIVSGWDMKFQFLFYLWLKKLIDPKSPVQGYVINAIKKPELRQGKKETLEGFAQRVRQDMFSEPTKYFYREYYPINKKILARFQEHVVDPKINRIRLGIDQPEFFSILFEDKNTYECNPIGRGACQFLDICRHGLENHKHLFEVREHKHQELNDTDE